VQDANLLGTCEYFFMRLMDLPHLASRLSAVLFERTFSDNNKRLQDLLDLTVTAASDLRGSSDFRLLLQHILAVGNRLNQGTSKGGAQVCARCLPCYKHPSQVEGVPRMVSCDSGLADRISCSL
jgi:hypothetical protein